MPMSEQAPVLLNDEQVQRFIADGMLVLDVNLPSALHTKITEELHFSLKEESRWLGDNLLPRVPQINEVLSSPIVTGAISSLLGPDFAWAPHRFPHNSEPLEADASNLEFNAFTNGPKMGKGSISGSGWHQDGHSKAARSRWHTFKAINMFYFPHDVPLEMGPTRLLAGSHLYATLREIVPEQVMFQPVKAGTVVIADFDVGHAGSPNVTESSRYMLKFVALRNNAPDTASWDHRTAEWHTPRNLQTPQHVPACWQVLWDWLRGEQFPAARSERQVADIPVLLEGMNAKDNEVRLNAMYELIQLGEAAISALVARLLSTAGQDRFESPALADPGYYAMSTDHLERRFSQRQFVPEDAAIALGLIGEDSLSALVPMLDHADPWIRINTVYAVGEVGRAVPRAVADQVGELLDDDLHQVVRAAADALCWLDYGPATIARALRLLTNSRADWQVGAMGEPKLGGAWSIENHLRYVLAWMLRSHADRIELQQELEDAMLQALPVESGYTPSVLCQGLELIGTNRSLKAVIKYLQPRRWDAFSFKPPANRAAA